MTGLHNGDYLEECRQQLENLRIALNAGLDSNVWKMGAEVEIPLIDQGTGETALSAFDLSHKIHQGQFCDCDNSPESFPGNLELNIKPQVIGADCLKEIEQEMIKALVAIGSANMTTDINGNLVRAKPIFTGISPGLTAEMFGVLTTPKQRYVQLNNTLDALLNARGESGQLLQFVYGDGHIVQLPRMNRTDIGMGSSIQPHIGCPAKDFAWLMNISRALMGILQSATVASPRILGHKVPGYQEGRIWLWEELIQMVDFDPMMGRGGYLKEGTTDGLYEAIKAQFDSNRPLILNPELTEECNCHHPLSALCHYMGTGWFHIRPCVAFVDGEYQPHVELRNFSTGPSIPDMMSLLSVYLGLVLFFKDKGISAESLLSYDEARDNFYHAVEKGLDAELAWCGERFKADKLLLDVLLPYAHQGLKGAGIDDGYVGHLERSVGKKLTAASFIDAVYEQFTNVPEDVVGRGLALYMSDRPCSPIADWCASDVGGYIASITSEAVQDCGNATQEAAYF
ncbi:MAG: hypothetical protein PHC51_01365 [bacterium]|nr:hypothetical protein [bacterium]